MRRAGQGATVTVQHAVCHSHGPAKTSLLRSYKLNSNKIVTTQAACTAAASGCLLPGCQQCY